MNEIQVRHCREKYVDWMTSTNAKSPLTVKKEKAALKGWGKFLPGRELSTVTAGDILDYAKKRSRAGINPRTVNLDVLALANMLKWARKAGYLDPEKSLVTDNWEPLKYVPKRRTLVTGEQFGAILTEARSRIIGDDGTSGSDCCYNEAEHLYGDRLADLLEFMAYSGARRQAALTARWENVDWINQQLTLFTKFDKKVVVDFNSNLRVHLKKLHALTGAGVTEGWIFPSPDDPKKHWANPGPLCKRVARAAGVPDFSFHDLRHSFISKCIMAGIDTLTVAAWVGHADGGVLIGKIYGHLNPQHRREAAQKLSF